MILIKQSTASTALVFFMRDSDDHVSGKAGLSPAVSIRKAGGNFAAPAGSVSEIGNGFYQVAANATDVNTLGPLVLYATATGAAPSQMGYQVVAFDPNLASLGLVLAKTTNLTGLNDIAAGDVRTELAAELGRMDVAISSRNATAPDNAGIAAIQAKTDNLPASPAAAADIPSPATVAKQVRTELTTELGRIDEAVSAAKTLTTGERATLTAAIEAALLNEGDGQMLINAIVAAIGNSNIDQVALIAAIRADLERTGGSLKFIEGKTSAIPESPAVAGESAAALAEYGPATAEELSDAESAILSAIDGIESGGGGGGLTPETVEKLEAADQIFLAAPYVPQEPPVLIIPQPDPDESLTVVYAYTESITNVKRAGIVLTFSLAAVPARSERLLEAASKTAVTNGEGYAAITLQRGLEYRVRCPDLGLDHKFTTTGETIDMLTLVS